MRNGLSEKSIFNAGNLKTALFIMGGLLFLLVLPSFILLWLFVSR